MRHEEIKTAYQSLGKEATPYGRVTACSTLPSKLTCGLVWRMNKPRNDHYLDLALSGIPEDFSGRVLEVPVGTGILTMSVYQTLSGADITCLGYSTVMMETVQRRVAAAGLSNVHFAQGDVGSLSFSDNTFDLVLSLNGLHAFPSKETAYRKTFRVLKPSEIFCGYFYVQGGQSQTGWFIEKLHVLRGFLTPPFGIAVSLENRMKQRCAEVTVTTVGPMECFCCAKGSEDTITHRS